MEVNNMNEIKIIPYAPEHWEAICRIHDAARKIELELAGLSGAFLPLEVAAEREGLFDDQVDVALMDGDVVGFCAYTEEEFAWLYVSPDHMRKGVGRALIGHALERQPGISSIEVLKGNEPARQLYERMGFSVRETLTGRMPGNEAFEVTVYCMEKK